jgi:hypothetical protein
MQLSPQAGDVVEVLLWNCRERRERIGCLVICQGRRQMFSLKRMSTSSSFPLQHATMTAYKSVSKSGMTTCVSGSPNRQLNSSTFGPSGVSLQRGESQDTAINKSTMLFLGSTRLTSFLHTRLRRMECRAWPFSRQSCSTWLQTHVAVAE